MKNKDFVSKFADITTKQQQRQLQRLDQSLPKQQKFTDIDTPTLFTNFSQTNPKSLIRPEVYKYATDNWIFRSRWSVSGLSY